MSAQVLRIGTRASKLALWQSNRVAELIRAQPGAPSVELVHIRTEGDARTDVPLWQVGGRAFFTREIDRAQLAGTIDLAVHSLKDLPTTLEAGLELAAVLEREDPRDALLLRAPGTLESLPAAARVGTSSLRRRAFLARARRDLVCLELRGNVPTRLDRLAAGAYDAIVLAAAGVKRLGLQAHVSAYLPPERFPPAVSQGAIAVVTRSGNEASARWVRALDHPATHLATAAERALLRRIEGGCQVPLGALAVLAGGRLELSATVCALDGSDSIEVQGASALPAADALAVARALGERLGSQLLSRGASRLIEAQRSARAAEAP